MIDISDSIAKKTVKFDRPLKGSEVIEAVRAACGDDRSFVQQHRYDDGHLYAVGRSSSYEYDNVLVTPNKTDAYIRADETYDSAVVVSHDLGGGQRYGVRGSDGAEIEAVLEFAGQLEQHLPSGRQEDLGRGRDPYAPAAGAVARRPDAAPAPRQDGAAASHQQGPKWSNLAR
ncbi:hypothetical protein ABZX12_18115 [Kribbella sp. NPDC003505]|uniref:hypothetical protein n=1 Tax=Kribbella sp. NPDC003505 TaxID=3154448 RepID=UPI0033A21966